MVFWPFPPFSLVFCSAFPDFGLFFVFSVALDDFVSVAVVVVLAVAALHFFAAGFFVAVFGVVLFWFELFFADGANFQHFFQTPIPCTLGSGRVMLSARITTAPSITLR